MADYITLLFSSSATSFAYPAEIHIVRRQTLLKKYRLLNSLFHLCRLYSVTCRPKYCVNGVTREGTIHFHKELESEWNGPKHTLTQQWSDIFRNNKSMLYHHYQTTWTYFCSCKRHQTIVKGSSYPLIWRCQIWNC